MFLSTDALRLSSLMLRRAFLHHGNEEDMALGRPLGGRSLFRGQPPWHLTWVGSNVAVSSMCIFCQDSMKHISLYGSYVEVPNLASSSESATALELPSGNDNNCLSPDVVLTSSSIDLLSGAICAFSHGMVSRWRCSAFFDDC